MTICIACFMVMMALLTAGPAFAQDKKRPKKAEKVAKPEENAVDDDATDPKEKVLPVITTGAASTKFGLEYNLTLHRDDNGVERTGDTRPAPSTTIGLKAMKLKLDGHFTPTTTFKVSLDAAVPNDPVEYAKATAWLTKSIGVSAGKEIVNQGGFEQKNAGYDTVSLSPYNTDQTPLAISAGMFELHLQVAGEATLQIVQDKLVDTKNTNTGEPTRAAQPAVTLEWLGDFKMAHPLLQIGSYDDGKSRFVDAGLGLTLGAAKIYGDFIYDLRSDKYAIIASKTDEKTKLDSVHRLLALEASLEIKKVHELFVRVSSYEVDQPVDAATGQIDRGYNSESGSVRALDDDALTAALGFRLGLIQRYFRPFVALTDQRARFKMASDNDKTETRSDLGLQLGVTGEM